MNSSIMKKIILVSMLLAFSSLSYGKTELEEKMEALKVLKKYSETVACDTSFDDSTSLKDFLQDVYTIERDPEAGTATYYVLWRGDKGCAGGSGTSWWMVSELADINSIDKSIEFLVQNDDAFGNDFNEKINSRFIEKLQKINAKKFIVISSELSGDDSPNFPSKKYQYTLERNGYSWKVTQRKYLGKN